MGQGGGEAEADLDVVAHQGLEHPLGVDHHVVEAQAANLKELASAEGEQLLGELGGPQAGLANLLDVLPDRLSRPQIREGQLAVAQDRGQQVVEIMGDPPCQPADRLHLLGLAELLLGQLELLLGPLPFGDVEVDRHAPDGTPARIVQGGGRDAHVDPASVLVQPLGLVAGERVFAEHPGEQRLEFALLVQRHVDQPVPNGLVRRPAEGVFGCPIPAQHDARGVDPHDGERRGIHQRLEMVARRAYRLLRHLPLGDVVLGAPDPGEPSLLHHADHVVDEPVRRPVKVEFA